MLVQAISKKQRVFLVKRQVAKLFSSRCFVCHRRFGKGFTFHHKYYIPEEKTYKDFKDPLDYQLYIIDIVRNNPTQFLLLCHRHHYSVENLKKFGALTLLRLLKAVKMSKQERD